MNALRLWWHPPPVDHASVQPSVENYTCRRLFLNEDVEGFVSLHSKGPYNRVLDVRDMYYLTERTCIAQSAQGHLCHGGSAQLADGVGARFPVVLTYKYVCDQAIVSLLRAHASGKSHCFLPQSTGATQGGVD